ncbi:putative F-box/kelch-repeat protein At3g17280 [Diospyros lotus]|uniref:putative F-box/kelch-repeat protein At3g17280 n=1 Tax=Diospyros lotus TaxID=55363 RepID=UPI002252A58D|nr:putative F-box/kelch-repeat protein At3g17280 [Diospyros lotus]
MGPTRESNQYKIQRQGPSLLLRAIQERMSANKEKEETTELPETKWGWVAPLPQDLVFKILLLLPAESLHRSTFVCKAWFNLIKSSNFIEAQIPLSETVFIFLETISQRRPKTFYIESKLGLSQDPEQYSIFITRQPYRSYLNFLEIQDGKGKVNKSSVSGFKVVLATCNGLILATCEQNGGLLVMNPVTRKLIAIPLGTIVPRSESYGFIFSHLTREYKVVHLFRDESRHIGCEILSLSTRKWRGVDGPSFGLFRRFHYSPVAAIGALHWLPDKHGCRDLVSMSFDDEKFHTTNLPLPSSVNDRLVEIGGFLGFVARVGLNKIEVWVLKGLQGESWVKRHIITSDIQDLAPLSTLQHGREMVFKGSRDSSFCTYNFESREMKKVEMETETVHGSRRSYLPHVNTLASWESLGALW